jgi:hydroxyethylthiazole kinase-like uncharacterized protein yjeF
MKPPPATSAAGVAHRTPVYPAQDIRRIEALAAAGGPPLMERAGLAAAERARALAPGDGGPLLVIAGPGNNGGDALVAARHLRQWFYDVTVVFAGEESRLPADAAAAWRAWRAAGGRTLGELPSRRGWALVVDGLFGLGLKRELTGAHAALVEAVNALGAPVLALDAPSGLDADSGCVRGCAVRATHTVTFIALKPGLLTLDGPDCCGELRLEPLGVDAAALLPPPGTVIGAGVLDALPRRRARNSHKGDYGSVAVIGGAPGMTGAALLAARAALKLGAGRVHVGLLAAEVPPFDPGQPELMLRRAGELPALAAPGCIVAGPGLGRSPAAAECLARALEAALPLADRLRGRRQPTLLTPHPAEAARLLGCATRAVQQDRVAAAVGLARGHGCGVVLKGAGSVCALPDGRWAINTSGNPGMASAGMGDALAGILAALIAQGMAAHAALEAGVYLHGAAADALVAAGLGPAGLTASEVIEAARALFNGRRA